MEATKRVSVKVKYNEEYCSSECSFINGDQSRCLLYNASLDMKYSNYVRCKECSGRVKPKGPTCTCGEKATVIIWGYSFPSNTQACLCQDCYNKFLKGEFPCEKTE